MKKLILVVFHLPKNILIALIKVYRLVLSPWLGGDCRFEPTCSVYALEALKQHGAAAGSALTVYRLVRCQPWCRGGHDPVPATAVTSLFTRLLAPHVSAKQSSSNEKTAP